MADLRVEKTRKALKRAFLELLEKKKFEDITIAELCELAEVRRATFYAHFSDKYEFLSFYFEDMRQEFISRFEKDASGSHESETTGSYYRYLFHEMILFFSRHPSVIKQLRKSQVFLSLNRLLTEYIIQDIYRHIRTTCPGDEASDTATAYYYSGGIMELLHLWMEDPEHFNEDVLANFF